MGDGLGRGVGVGVAEGDGRGLGVGVAEGEGRGVGVVVGEGDGRGVGVGVGGGVVEKAPAAIVVAPFLIAMVVPAATAGTVAPLTNNCPWPEVRKVIRPALAVPTVTSKTVPVGKLTLLTVTDSAGPPKLPGIAVTLLVV